MLLGRHQLTRHDSACRLVRDSVTSSSEYPGLLQKLPIHSSTPIRHRQPATATRQARRQQALSDDHSEVEPLLPIPNRNVKRFCADDSGPAPVKVGHRQTPYSSKSPYRVRAFFSSIRLLPSLFVRLLRSLWSPAAYTHPLRAVCLLLYVSCPLLVCLLLYVPCFLLS